MIAKGKLPLVRPEVGRFVETATFRLLKYFLMRGGLFIIVGSVVGSWVWNFKFDFLI